MYKNIAIALLIGSTEGIKLSSFERNVVESHYVNKGWGSGGGGPGIAPVTFEDDSGCTHTYSIGSSRTAPESGCNGGAIPAKVQDKEDKKQGKATTEAKEEIEKKEVEAAKATIAEAKAPKPEAAAAEAAFLQTDYVNKGWGSSTPGPGIKPVTFQDGPCTHTYDHSHSVSAGPSACNRGPETMKVEKEPVKVAKETAAASAEGEARVAAKDAKEAAEAKEEIAAKEGGGKAKAAKKSESEASAPEAAPAKAPEAQPAKASLLLLETDKDVFPKHEYRTKEKPEGPSIEPITFRDKSQGCTQTYDHSHSVTNPSGD